MTVIRPNSISGITSITAQANEINVFKSDGTLAGLSLNGVNVNTTTGISTYAALNVTGNISIGGTLTYQDVTNVDSVGIVTAREGIFIPDNKVLHLGNVSGTGDLQIYHDTSHSYVKDVGTGDLVLQTQGGHVRIKYGSDTMALFQPSGYSQLYFANSKKFETTNGGALVTGDFFLNDNGKLSLGTGGDLKIFHESSSNDNVIDCATTRPLRIRFGGNNQFEFLSGGGIKMNDGRKITLGDSSDFSIFHDGAGANIIDCRNARPFQVINDTGGVNETMIKAAPNGAVELYFDNSRKFETASQGFNLKEGGTTRLSFTYSNSLAFITANAGNEIKVSSGNGDANGIEFWDYSGVNKRCQIDGHGIKFNADTAAANALDDYEEGSWTPVISGGSGTTHQQQYGRYRKIGGLIVVSARIQFSCNGSSGNSLSVGGLPYTSISGTGENYTSGGITYCNLSLDANRFHPYINDGSTFVKFYEMNSGAGVNISGSFSNKYLGFSAHYFV